MLKKFKIGFFPCISNRSYQKLIPDYKTFGVILNITYSHSWIHRTHSNKDLYYSVSLLQSCVVSQHTRDPPSWGKWLLSSLIVTRKFITVWCRITEHNRNIIPFFGCWVFRFSSSSSKPKVFIVEYVEQRLSKYLRELSRSIAFSNPRRVDSYLLPF